MLLLFIPIGIMVDVAEKIDKFKENEIPLSEIVSYYVDFTWYFGNLLFPFSFFSRHLVTSKLANNTEVIAILSSGISFNRFLRPYLISATVIAFLPFWQECLLFQKPVRGSMNFRLNTLTNGKTIAKPLTSTSKSMTKNSSMSVIIVQHEKEHLILH